MGRLSGRDLEAFLQKEFARRAQVRFGANLTPQRLAHRLGEASPADAISVLNKAINASFADGQAGRQVCMADIEAAIKANITVSGSGAATRSEGKWV